MAANLAILMVAEYRYLNDELKLHCIGIVGDTAGDERKAQLDMMKEHPSLLIAGCWVHQVICQ